MGHNVVKKSFQERLVKTMPSIKPISDLRNYTEVLKEVDTSSQVYLTRNGHVAYAIVPIAEIDELDKMRAFHLVLGDLKRAEERANAEGWINSDDLEKELGIYD